MNGVKNYVSVICEYNPFHYGHAFQIKTLKNRFDGVICIMSGNIVQRGSVAVADKYIRAEAALNAGANLVLEFPIPWCCSSARDFAAAGVKIADFIRSDYLAFGAEDDLELLKKIRKYISTADFDSRVKKFVEENKSASYPYALSKVIEEEFGIEEATAVSKPNNILALEYLAALEETSVLPYAVKRDMALKSSSNIRSLELGEEMIKNLPEESASVFERALGIDFPRDGRKLDSFYIGTLRRIKNVESDYYSAPDDLVKKILSESVKVSSVEALVNSCTDKVYTNARVRRAINSIVFGITTDRVKAFPPYTCVLAADETGRKILKNAKNNDNFDIITKPVKALNASEATKDAFSFAKSIEDVIALSAPQPEPADKGMTPKIINTEDR